MEKISLNKNSSLKVYEVSAQNQLVLVKEFNYDFTAAIMKPDPKKPNLIAIATSTNQLYVLDITNGEVIAKSETHYSTNKLTSLNWSCNSSLPIRLTLTYSDGSFELYGNENEMSTYKKAPQEQFFKTDHTSIIINYDTKNKIFIDDETKKQPHLLPNGDLTKLDGSIIYMHESDDSVEMPDYSKENKIIISSEDFHIM
jgi:hypothetical protein